MKIILSAEKFLAPDELAAFPQGLFLLLPDSAFCRPENPFFLSDFADRFVALPATAVRISKVGKSIARRFAHRYSSEAAPAALIIASGLLQTLRDTGLPWTSAIAYDRSVLTGNFSTVEALSNQDDICRAIETISRTMTLKTGDILIVPSRHYDPANLPPLAIGEELTLTDFSNDKINFRIR